VGDEVEVFLDRIENALGEAVLSRDKARREESWGKLEKAFNNNEKVHGVIFNQVKGGFTVDLDGRSGLPAALAGRHPPDSRRRTADEQFAAVPDSQDGSPPRQHRGVAPHGSRRDPPPNSARNWCRTSKRARSSTASSRNITDYGAFVDLGGIDGLLHVTDIAWRRVNHPTEVLTIGQTVKVKIIKINHETTAYRSA